MKKISETIKALQAIMDEHGDVDIDIDIEENIAPIKVLPPFKAGVQ